jgi:hypothetical protein
VRPGLFLVEGHEIEQAEVAGHLRDHQRHRQLVGVGDEVLAVLLEQFLAIFRYGRGGG